MLKKKFAGALVASLALSMVATVAPTATAAPKAANIAVAGDDCVKADRVAKGRGVEGSDLTCLVVSTGTLKGKLKWWYKDVTPLSKLEWVAASGVGGGYGTTAIAFADAMKAEACLAITQFHTSLVDPELLALDTSRIKSQRMLHLLLVLRWLLA